MRALVLYSTRNGNAERLASAISEGARKAYARTETARVGAPQDLAQFGLVFIGFEIPFLSADSRVKSFALANKLQGKKLALFCAYSFTKKPFREVEELLKKRGASVVNTLGLKTKGRRRAIGKGRLSEEDLVRAEAFGEKTVNNLLNRRITKESEKARIKNYKRG